MSRRGRGRSGAASGRNDRGEQRGVRLVMHGGFSRGYGSMIQMVPAHGFAVIVVTNRSGETLPRTTLKAQELFLPLAPETPPVRQELALTAEDRRRFVGVYENGKQVWEVFDRDGKLHLRSEGTEAALIKTGPWRLGLAEAPEQDVAFVAGPGDQAEYVFTGLYAGRRRRAPEQPAGARSGAR